LATQTSATGRPREALSIARVLDAFRPQRAGVLYALIVVIIVFQALTAAKGLPSYLGFTNIRNVLDQGALDGFLVIGMTVLLISGHFDLSIGATAGLAAGVSVDVANGHGALLAVLAALGVGLGVGIVNAVCVQVFGVNAFITTLGTLTALQGALLIISHDQTIQSRTQVFSSFGMGDWTVPSAAVFALGAAAIVAALAHGIYRQRHGAGLGADVAMLVIGGVCVLIAATAHALLTEARSVWVLAIVVVVVALLLRFTVVGRRLYAVGGNHEAARLSGIRVSAYITAGFLATGLAAAVGGILYAGMYGSVDPTALSTEELPVLAAAILGGTSLFGGVGYVTKSIIGVAILTVLANGFSVLNIGANYQYVVQGVVIVAAAAVFTTSMRRRRPAVATTTAQGAAGASAAGRVTSDGWPGVTGEPVSGRAVRP
jgi:D-xylose transport system permease protein